MIEEIENSEGAFNRFVNEKPWGIEALINIYGCDKELISDENSVFEYLVQLVDLIKMNAYGDPIIERFGTGNLLGISFVQLIHTSCIVGHISEETGTIYLDIFSCREYDADVAAEFTRSFFKGKKTETKVFLRD